MERTQERLTSSLMGTISPTMISMHGWLHLLKARITRSASNYPGGNRSPWSEYGTIINPGFILSGEPDFWPASSMAKQSLRAKLQELLETQRTQLPAVKLFYSLMMTTSSLRSTKTIGWTKFSLFLIQMMPIPTQTPAPTYSDPNRTDQWQPQRSSTKMKSSSSSLL